MQNEDRLFELWQTVGLRAKSHPWHGIEAGKEAPEIVTSYIEVVPGDDMKFEICKKTGYLMVDRPNKYSSSMPALYGFIPQTYSAEEAAAYCMERTGRTGIEGDCDPLDICVLTDRRLSRGDLLLDAVVIGGYRMIDGGEADDKIVAVLKGDHTYGGMTDISECPKSLVKRLKHYFLSYKEDPDKEGGNKEVEITHTYGREEALEVVRRTQKDYDKHFGSIRERLGEAISRILG